MTQEEMITLYLEEEGSPLYYDRIEGIRIIGEDIEFTDTYRPNSEIRTIELLDLMAWVLRQTKKEKLS